MRKFEFAEMPELSEQVGPFPDDAKLRAKRLLREKQFWQRYLRRCRVRTSWRRRARYAISAIVSTYQSTDFIETCLADLCGQTVASELEIIVINACSPQDEWEVVERFRRNRPNIVHVLTPERIGIYPAWNLAVCLARGRYLTSASTNDRLSPGAHEMLMKELETQPDVALVYGDSYVTDLPHQAMDSFVPSATDPGFLTWRDYDYRVLLQNCGVGPHPMWRRALHDELGFFDYRYEAVADQDFWLRIGWQYPMKHVAEFTGLFWKTPNGLAQNPAALTEVAAIHAKYQRFLQTVTPPSLVD